MVEKERLIELAQEAAPHLSGVWRYSPLATEQLSSTWQPRAVIVDAEQPGRAIRLGAHWEDRRRVGIAAAHGGSLVGSFHSGHITVSPERSGRAISGDINRRFLPGFLEAWREHQIYIAQRKGEQELFKQRLHLLRKFLPDLRPANRSDIDSDRFYFSRQDGRSGTVHMYAHHGADDAKIELRLSYDEMLKLVAFLAESN